MALDSERFEGTISIHINPGLFADAKIREKYKIAQGKYWVRVNMVLHNRWLLTILFNFSLIR
jgi:hypothetical protein